ncbi:protein of unknown function [Salegentibacter echinorum]|uniref:DUF5107 domain-containing protein n=1 Tax=Salegentibacter echinorum TaxID=1073325 RepID=A0A1M5IE42_SALEC|nr:DUF5107 domain-containing protein [Salegentibacter echinorum]SHG26542.1 protein of unknown function [Salegentibacter echinorum]
MKKVITLLALILAFQSINSQNNASIREYRKEYRTYPFSNPNPIPATKKIYPYFRYDGFTQNPVKKKWKVVELENEYIRVQIMPEIGGKIWGATDKKSGRDFLYNNDVVKFRDIALRGPWVSGGIEFNYGIIGHTPNSATPVDYLTKENPDGSVSCFISTLDLLTRTRWLLEIKLEKDKAYFTTRSYWFNSTAVEQPYYTWMNAGIPAGEDLQFLYPGTHYIGHGGEPYNWPLDNQGRNLAFYSENAFGGSKSFHVLGSHSNYFGGYWKDDDFGMIRYSNREDKLGKKIFLWAQSEQGKIWENLLTDNSGQYVEIQSGRLFNQNAFESSFTPFKQIGFAPYSTDRWTEYWYPFKGIGGFTSANSFGAFNIEKNKNSFSLKLSPVQKVQDTLKLFSAEGNQLKKLFLKAEPREIFEKEINLDEGEDPAYIIFKGQRIDIQNNSTEKELSRPLELPKEFDSESAYGLYLQGRDLYRFRNYELAEEKIATSLSKKALFLPSLVEMAKLKLFRMQIDSAYTYARKALSIDTYNPEANYYYGLAALEMNKTYDAIDGFEVASVSTPYRNAAYTALSKLYMESQDFIKAREYAKFSLQNNSGNLESLKILYLISRINNDSKSLNELEERIENLNPVDHFLNFENYYTNPTKENENNFKELIRNEMPFETYLELAIWYANINKLKESKRILELAPQNAIGLYWLAWLNRKSNPALSDKYLNKVKVSSMNFVFPFRKETAQVLKWASTKRDSWKSDYLLALIEEFRGNQKKAISLLKSYKNIEFAPFYVVKARLEKKDSLKKRLEYIRKAVALQPNEPRYGRLLAEIYLKHGEPNKAVDILEKYYKRDDKNYIVGLDLINAFIIADQFEDAEKVLTKIRVLPFEGADDAKEYYRQTKLMLAFQAMQNKNYTRALRKIKESEKWPSNLGVGRPYPELINNDLENALRAAIYKKSGNKKLFKEQIRKFDDQDVVDKETLLRKIRAISKSDERLF